MWAAPVGLMLLLVAYLALHSPQVDKTGVPVALPSPISVVDGDTVRSGGFTYRLVGFDTPESGDMARCPSERTLAAAATRRLQQMVAGGNANLERVPCACRAGTEETRQCNYGRRCGVLRVEGRDVAQIMIGEGLARSYICSGTRCPPRQSWCG